MNISLTTNNTHFDIVAILEGEFDALGCKEIRVELEAMTTQYPGSNIGLDLGDVQFIDSSGIGAIVFMYKRMLASKGSVSLINVKNQPRELISLLRIDEAISVQWADPQTSTTH